MSFKFLEKPSLNDYDKVINEDFILTDTEGNYQLIYVKLDDVADLVAASRSGKYHLKKSDIKPKVFDKYKSLIDSYIDTYFPDKKRITKVYYRKNQDIGYHRDRVPSENSMTATVCIRNTIQGGELVIPDFRLAVAQGHGYLCLFDGKKHHHGMIPIDIKNGGYRSIFVFHS